MKLDTIPSAWFGITENWTARNLLWLKDQVVRRGIDPKDLDAVRSVWINRLNPRLVWTDEMLTTLRTMRADNIPLLLCAEAIGVDYSTTVLKARELGISDRRNVGRKSGPQIKKETSS